VAGNYLVDSIVIPSVHEQVIAALSACSEVGEPAALGIIETYSLASAVICADAAVKAADIDLMEIRLGRGLGGKSFVTLTGDVAAANAAVAAAKDTGEEHGMMANTVVIPSPHPDMFKAIY
jgi:microcompartment protein CcmL/EutN